MSIMVEPAETNIAGLKARQWELEAEVYHLSLFRDLAWETARLQDAASVLRASFNLISGTLGAGGGVAMLWNMELKRWELVSGHGQDSAHVLLEVAADPEVAKWLREAEGADEISSVDVDLDIMSGRGMWRAALQSANFPLAFPILIEGEGAHAWLCLERHLTDEPYSQSDIDLVRSCLPLLSAVIYSRIVASRQLSQEMELWRIRGIFEEHYAPDVVERLLSSRADALRPQRRKLSVVMCDVRGFSTLTNRLDPEVLARVLDDYLGAMTDLVFEHGGRVDKFIGDAIMAVFGDPDTTPADAATSVACALKMQQRFKTLIGTWPPELRKPGVVGLGIGVCRGDVLCGRFGSARRKDYTVIGAPVNLSERLSAATHHGEIYLDENTWHELSDRSNTEPVHLPGESSAEAQPVYRIRS